MFKYIKAICTISIIAILTANTSFGQVDPNYEKNGKFAIGGDVSLSFGTYTFVNVSPKLGYRFNEKFMVGPGFIYQYYRDRSLEPLYTFSTNIVGASVFARHIVFENLAAYTEYQQLFYTLKTSEGNQSVAVPVFFVGGQYTSQIGGNFSVSISLLIDVLNDPNSPYQNPYYGLGGFYNF